MWFDTGLEYEATKEHLKYLEYRYNIQIKREKSIKPIPLACKQYGVPFISKHVSDRINRLKKHNFKWEDKTFEELYKEYPRCKSALLWWCNATKSKKLSIANNKWLKEFLIENPPIDIAISDMCCKYAKEDVARNLIKKDSYDLNITGIRKAEGGRRSTGYKSCFNESNSGCDYYRPIFWYKNENKNTYEDYYNIVHSDCYSQYGLKRTGCAGCPFGRDFEFELEVIKKYEPKLYMAVNSIFRESYEYTRKYKEFCKIKDMEIKIS